jgi:hypothetical protein
MAVTVDEARALALALDGAVEQDHHGRPSFRIAKKIFATLWSNEQMNVMLDEGGILTAIEAEPGFCSPVHWGKRLAAVGVALPAARGDYLQQLLLEAWELRRPAAT